MRDEYFHKVNVFVNDIKNIFKCQPQCHCHNIDHLKILNVQLENLPTKPFQACWGMYFDVVEYYCKHLDTYQSFSKFETPDAQNENS